VAGLLRHDGALVGRGQSWNELGGESADLLGVEVAHLLRGVHHRHNHLVMTLLLPLLVDATRSTDFDGKFLALTVPDKLTWLFFDVFGGTRRFENSSALLGPFSIANLFDWFVTLFNGFVDSLLFKSDSTLFLKILVTNFLLCGGKLSDVSIMALLNILMRTLQYWLFIQGIHFNFL